MEFSACHLCVSQQKTETAKEQAEKFLRLLTADAEKLKLTTGSDGEVTAESIEAVLQPKVISSVSEITPALSEPGRPYYFKLHALYKGYDKAAEQIQLQGLGKQSNTLDAVQGAVFGVDSSMSFVEISRCQSSNTARCNDECVYRRRNGQ